MEGACKAREVPVLADRPTHQACDAPSGFEPVGTQTIKGLAAPVAIYSLIDAQRTPPPPDRADGQRKLRLP